MKLSPKAGLPLEPQPHGGALVKPPKGVSGNPAGRTKGTRNLATIIRDLEDEDFNWDLLPTKEAEVRERFKKYKAPWVAVMYVALAKAVSGDTKAMEWLRKSGYGDKLDLTTKGKEITQPAVISVIKARADDRIDDDVAAQRKTKADS